MPPKELGLHLKQCISASLIAKYFVIMLYLRAKERVDAGGPCLRVNGRPSVLRRQQLTYRRHKTSTKTVETTRGFAAKQLIPRHGILIITNCSGKSVSFNVVFFVFE
jgi:hypothetical protein